MNLKVDLQDQEDKEDKEEKAELQGKNCYSFVVCFSSIKFKLN